MNNTSRSVEEVKPPAAPSERLVWHSGCCVFVALPLLAVLAALLLAGCTTAPPSTAEATWLLVDAVDTAQTVAIARNPGCLYERDKLAAALYGSKHPTVGRVLGTNAVMAALHWQVSAWVDRHSPPWLRITFYGVSIGASGRAVVGNMLLGVRPVAGGQCRVPQQP